MFSKPLAFVLLALGCLTAAAGGAYVATRHNMSDLTTRPSASAPAALASPASTEPAAAPHAVAETEAAVSTPKADPPAVQPAEAEPAPPRVEAAPAHSAARPAAPARTPATNSATMSAAKEPSAPRPAQRTVPMTAGTSAGQPDAMVPPQAAQAPASSAAPPRPNEAAKPVEDPLPEPPRAPLYDELILPASSVIGLQVETALSTERARLEDRVDARVSRDVMSGGRVAIPAGSRVIGSVTTVERGGKMKEQARLGIRFHTLVLADGTQVQLHTDPIYRVGEDPTAGSTKKIGGAAIGGAIIGAILGGGKGAAIGGAAGAGAGSAAVMASDRQAATLRQGEYLNVKLSTPATLTVERRE